MSNEVEVKVKNEVEDTKIELVAEEPIELDQPETEVPQIENAVEEIATEPVVETPSEQPVTDEKPAEEKPEESPKPDKRKAGKGIIAYKNGEEFMRFPSIKAAAQHFKDLKELGHMPFTPIMKSVRQGIDWEEYSFKHEKDEDLHIPESLKVKLSKQAEEKSSKPIEEKQDEQSQEPIEEIVEIPQEQL